MRMEYKIAFVILHYQIKEITKVCIACLEKNFKEYPIEIIVVDNASPNKSGVELEKYYKNNSLVTIIHNSENLGFSKGNNIGYQYARKRGADFIVIMNNDVEIEQQEFIDLMVKKYEQKNCHVIGPDIINLEGIHQSPQRDHFISKFELWKWYRTRKVFLTALFAARKFSLFRRLLIKLYSKHDKGRIASFNSKDEQEDVELQGACFIFTPIFVKKNEYPFEEISFMYGEETMLGIRCQKEGWHTLYYPTLKVFHKEKSTTRGINADYIEHEIFYTSNLARGIKGIIEKMNEWGM